MKYEIEVDSNLLYLQNVLFDLSNYKFDKDILALLNQLQTLLTNKMYSKYDFDSFILDKKIKITLITE